MDVISSVFPVTKLNPDTLMTRTFLLRGMLVGVAAGLLVFVFARWLGEPQIERAMAFERSMNQACGEAPEPEMISRRIQKSIGLLTGTVLYGVAIGGIFGLAFAFVNGRTGITSPKTLSAFLAGIGFVTIVLIPNLKYPANPPAVGNPETIGIRTATFFFLSAFSVAAVVFSVQLTLWLRAKLGLWNSSLLAAIVFIAIMGVVSHFLPDLDEVPPGFPVTLMWKFRVAALEVQAVLWATLGFLFGWLTERDATRA